MTNVKSMKMLKSGVLSARMEIVSSKGALVNSEETSEETRKSPLLIFRSWTSLTKSKVSVIVYLLAARG